MKIRPRRIKKVLFSLVAAAMFFAAVEGGFRLLYPRIEGRAKFDALNRYAQNGRWNMIRKYRGHPDYLYTFKPNPPRVGESGFTGPVPAKSKQAGEMRIVVLGDSTSAGEHAWPALLAALLTESGEAPTTVSNLAIPGYTSREGLAVMRGLGRKLQPDILIAAFGHNDLQAGMYAGFKSDYSHFRKPFSPPKSAKASDRLDRFMTKSFLTYAFVRRRMGLPPLLGYRLNDYIMPAGARSVDHPYYGWNFKKAFASNIQEIVKTARNSGARPYLLTTPWCRAKCPKQSLGFVEAGMKVVNDIIRAQENTPVIDLDKELSGRCGLFLDHVHSTPAGDGERARIIFRALQ